MRSPRGFGCLMLMAVCLATSATARSSRILFERQLTCPLSDQSPCSLSGLPSNFCCPTGQSCIPLAANTTLLCCPTGQDCSIIKSIPCDIQLQNVTAHPDDTLKTTALTVALPTCGSQCCPFGFTCNASGNCVKDADQTVKPGASAPSAPSGTTSSTKPASTSSSSTNTHVAAQGNKIPVAAVLAGFFPGLALGITLTVICAWFWGKRRRENHIRSRRSGSSFGNISDPQPTGDMRTDFLRKAPATPSTTNRTPSRRNTIQRVRSIFSRSPSSQQGSPPPPQPPVPLNIRRPMPQEQRPVTPTMQREPSYEDISIFTDGNTASSLRERERNNGNLSAGFQGGNDVRASHQTTFSDMMDRSGVPPAGLKKNSRESSPVPDWV
jgi:hypothetical protein